MNIHIYVKIYSVQKAVNKQDNSHRVQSPTLQQHQFGVITWHYVSYTFAKREVNEFYATLIIMYLTNGFVR